MHASHVYTIFWRPPEANPFQTSPSYESTVNAYFERVAQDSSGSDNVYSVATQYFSGAENPIAYSSSFVESAVDESPFPSSSCTDTETPSVCLSDKQLQEAIKATIEVKHWTAGPESIFFLYTPEGVGSCFNEGEKSSEEGECAYTYYCAYHSNFTMGSSEVIYANMPYEATPSCDDEARPEGSDAGPAIDTTSHENLEAITDPAEEGWWDEEGNQETNPDWGMEIGDLCLPLEFSASYALEVYGPLLGNSQYNTASAYNQVIGGHNYLLQREWSNAAGTSIAGKTPGACVQLLLPVVFTPPAASATQPASFDASASGTVEDPVTSWSWSFGDGSGGEGADLAHTYATAGEYTVTLTVTDARGDSNTASHHVHVTPPPPPLEEIRTSTTSTSTATSTAAVELSTATTTTTTTTSNATPPAHLSSVELARLLGLPANDASLDTAGTITLGRASCPPSCSLTASLYARVRTVRHHHRVAVRELVGSAHFAVAPGATTPILVKLNATGRALLRRSHRLVVQLAISATDQRGAGTQVLRILTLLGPGRAVHHRR